MTAFIDYQSQYASLLESKKTLRDTIGMVESAIIQIKIAIEIALSNHDLMTEETPRHLEAYEGELEEKTQYLKILQERLEIYSTEHRIIHLNMIWDLEERNIPIHTIHLEDGPAHPNSYLLYKDGSNLVFPRGNQDRYSSYRFWIEYQYLKEPIQMLGQDYYSAKELNVEPPIIDRLYELENRYLKNDRTVESEIHTLRVLLNSKM
jgi:hypothetical protein